MAGVSARTFFLLAILVAVAIVPLSACGGDEDGKAETLYRDYRSADDERSDAESRLREAFSDIARFAERRDRTSTLAAVEEARGATREIDELLQGELEAAAGLGDFPQLTGDADLLERGLEQTRRALGLLVDQLEIGAHDPFLEQEENAATINRLAQEAASLSVKSEVAIRNADRALADTLGLTSRPDSILDAPTTGAP